MFIRVMFDESLLEHNYLDYINYNKALKNHAKGEFDGRCPMYKDGKY